MKKGQSRPRQHLVKAAIHLVPVILSAFLLLLPSHVFGKIYIDINSPSARKFNIAIPDFQNNSLGGAHPELGRKLREIVARDLKLSGYFNPIDKGAYLGGDEKGISIKSIRFRNWTVIGADLLLKGAYSCTGQNLEVDFRLFDVFWGREIIGKKLMGNLIHFRSLMHRLGNEIIKSLTGHEGIFLTKLAFVGTATGNKEIYRCDFDGYNARRVTRDNSIALLPKWSPDGSRLIYTSYKSGKGPMLYILNPRNGKTRRLSGRTGLNIGASWAPGGKKVALTLSRKGDSNIFTIGLDGKILKKLTRHWGIDVSPSFSPDGKKLAFVSSRSGSPQVYILDLVRGTERRLTFVGDYNTSPSWSSRDEIAFVSKQDGHFDICVINPDGGGLRMLTRQQGDNEDPCWSPGGRYIIFSSNRLGRYHLYLMNSNGRNQYRITSMKGDQTSPSWGPSF